MIYLLIAFIFLVGFAIEISKQDELPLNLLTNDQLVLLTLYIFFSSIGWIAHILTLEKEDNE